VGAFVLCSGFSRGDENIRTLWAADENELEDKNNCRETKTQGGWNITEEYANGNFKATSNDGKIEITVNPVEDNQKSQNKEVTVNAWGNTIIINNDGISVTDKNNKKIITSSSGISIKDDTTDVIKYDSSSIPKKVTILGHLEVTV
jgi:co-chaperonin GroES (HSP10)